jgi:hypothetical protein
MRGIRLLREGLSRAEMGPFGVSERRIELRR